MPVYRKISAYIATASALLVPAIANAAEVTDTFSVEITIVDTCTVTAGGPANIDFGEVETTETDLLEQGVITVNCSLTTPYTIGLTPSNADTTGAGEMESTDAAITDVVPYQLYSDAGTTAWGSAALGDPQNGLAGTGTGLDETYDVYAGVASTNYTPGSYIDTVTVTVFY
ncbi:Csu type fimbrial protein [Novosphingobium guangzhouense]|uniref:Spore coat protein U/FanG domain-containing protein n=1 Tax=Novosphingobium guangzhouense TaxID=1850347 RepID=A0A2K2G651_9SPHN|nr:spore coat U domain-containing protein [Novosphingobium guangzhouense]PNU06517.1 hypothetical protein A8V01_02970 [Novosphingobium guangzhouense]